MSPEQELDHLRHVLGKAEIEHKASVRSVGLLREQRAQSRARLQSGEEAQQILQSVAQAVQQTAHSRIAGVVSRCLETVFDQPYEFDIQFERKRGRTEADLSFVRNGMRVDPMTASGGGVIDVAAFALRLACLVLARPLVRRLVVLDEPFKFLSKQYRPRVKALLMGLAKDMNVQFVMVTHIPELVCGTVIDLEEI